MQVERIVQANVFHCLQILIFCKRDKKSASFQDKYVYLPTKQRKNALRAIYKKKNSGKRL
ncbi:hypothetical protein DXA58_05685 [Bacteroides uniformis]|nr:hypothetical protein DXA58_05685 [Bacteroides uniformis]RJU27750.1 hypothetical protein DW995_10975 [Bacteroides sp. AM51-7]